MKKVNAVTFLAMAIVLNMAMLVYLGLYSYNTFREKRTIRALAWRTEVLCGTIVHLDEVLTMSARMAALTGDAQWEARYRRYEPKLSAAIEEAIALAPKAYSKGAAQIDAANTKFVEMENRSFDLIRRGNADDAQSILFSDEYDTEKRSYIQDISHSPHETAIYLQIEVLRGTIVHLDEVLTMSARMAAFTGDAQWEARYRRYEPKLGTAIEEAIALAPEAYSKGAAQTDAANTKLVEMENRSFDLIRRGNADDAQSILLSKDYQKQKKIYWEGMLEFADNLSDMAAASLESDQRNALLHLLSAMLVIPILLVGWFGVFRAVHTRESALRESSQQLLQKSEELAAKKQVLGPGGGRTHARSAGSKPAA